MKLVEAFFSPSTHKQAAPLCIFFNHDLLVDYMPKAGEYYLLRRANKLRKAETVQGESKR